MKKIAIIVFTVSMLSAVAGSALLLAGEKKSEFFRSLNDLNRIVNQTQSSDIKLMNTVSALNLATKELVLNYSIGRKLTIISIGLSAMAFILYVKNEKRNRGEARHSREVK